MLYHFVFREITSDDLDNHCHFMPEEHEFEMHMEALAHDIEWLEGVTVVRRDGSHGISVEADTARDLLKKQLVPLLQNHWAYLRIEL